MCQFRCRPKRAGNPRLLWRSKAAAYAQPPFSILPSEISHRHRDGSDCEQITCYKHVVYMLPCCRMYRRYPTLSCRPTYPMVSRFSSGTKLLFASSVGVRSSGIYRASKSDNPASARSEKGDRCINAFVSGLAQRRGYHVDAHIREVAAIFPYPPHIAHKI
jgi:hypothetical protein